MKSQNSECKKWCVAICAMISLLISGCATKQNTMYQWGRYEPEVYEYLKGDGASYADQINALELDLEKAKSSNRQVPPGYQAHLGMLYAHMGNYDKMAECFAAEKTMYPEATPFMDFLLKSAKK